ncbi:hypothetical protein ACFPOB_16245 [Bosea eneae]|uniref:Uncharacterized protein n=1 Tax=Bosea eneae TaxID=151454 RepID=A0ABW0IS23_9HYPH
MTDKTLSIAEVREWTSTVFDALERQGMGKIVLEHNEHWGVFFEDALNLAQQPELIVGSLADDIGDLRREMLAYRSEDHGMIISHACHHLIGIMKYLAFTAGGATANASDVDAGGTSHA